MEGRDGTKAFGCIELLQEVLMEAFQIEAFLFTPPYGDFSKIDHGIRNMIWPDFSMLDDRPFSAEKSSDRRIIIIKSNLGFYNILIYLTLDASPDFISVGPFRAEEFTSDNLAGIIGERHLTDTAAALRSFYKSLPYVPLSSVVNITKRIITVFYPEIADAVPVSIGFSEQKHIIHINTDLLHDFSAEMAEAYQQALFRFLDEIKAGELAAARVELKSFLLKARFTSAQNMNEYKIYLNRLNEYCHMALLQTSVHPVYSLRQYASLRQRIINSNSQEALLAIPNEICHKYCLLVKNYAFSEYSKTIRDVINYMKLHLEEDLTLSLIADHFNKNPTSLSGCFSREVGMSITDCIHKMRINEALRYFNTTKKSVSEVAMTVGFQDFAYFSRLFRRQIGCSPREYCRSIR